MSIGTDTLLAGRYRVVERLGSGGMATVYLAEDERLGRKVAVKRLHAESPEDMAARFVREAKLGASLNHPNLVSIFDTDQDDEGVLIVMEYVEGESLAKALKLGPLPTHRALDVIDGVAKALDHAHANGVVHRDVKPANVLIGKDGTPKLVDLGIATAAEASQITRSGTILGTPAYIAPERLEGGTGGPEADVYALAVVAFELLTGRRARQGSSPIEIAHKVATEPPPDLAEAMPTAPRQAADVLSRAMSREPSRRHAGAGELARELREAFDDSSGEGVTAATQLLDAKPPPPPRRPARARAAAAPPPPRRARRQLSGLALVGMIALFLVAAALAISALSGGDEQNASDGGAASTPAEAAEKPKKPAEEQKTTEKQQTAEEQQGEAPSGASPAELNDQGYAALQAGNLEQAIPLLERSVRGFRESGGTGDLNYAFALYNLGDALIRAGRPADAIPLLEERLNNPNQREIVQKRLEEAYAAAGRGGKKRGKKKDRDDDD